MDKATKKQDKTRAKLAKKQAKATLKRPSDPGEARADSGSAGSPAVRYAEFIRGGLYLVMGGSLLAALALGQRGAMISLDDVVDGLFAARAGKVVLALIAVALVIYGLKHLRLMR